MENSNHIKSLKHDVRIVDGFTEMLMRSVERVMNITTPLPGHDVRSESYLMKAAADAISGAADSMRRTGVAMEARENFLFTEVIGLLMELDQDGYDTSRFRARVAAVLPVFKKTTHAELKIIQSVETRLFSSC